MECVFGLVGNGFALIAADASAVHSILLHKSNEDKVMVLDSHKLMGASGEAGDRAQFTEYVKKNVALYQFRNGIPLTTAAAANFTRGELAVALRKNPYMVNILMAGYDKETGPSLYFIDYIATLHKVDKGAFGYGAFFSLAMMDRHYHSGMSVEEAIDLVDKCIVEIRSRLVVAPPNFVIKIVDKDGAREYAWRETVKEAPKSLSQIYSDTLGVMSQTKNPLKVILSFMAAEVCGYTESKNSVGNSVSDSGGRNGELSLSSDVMIIEEGELSGGLVMEGGEAIGPTEKVIGKQGV
ncbi:hypothetical protein V2J09_011444 [Rumex salicifolius]